MTDDSLLELQQQALDVALVVVLAAGAWLGALGLVALRHRRSPEVAHACLRRLGAPALLCRVLLLLVCVGVAQPAHASADDAAEGARGADTALRLAEALDGLPSPALPAPGPAVVARPEGKAAGAPAAQPAGAREARPREARPREAHSGETDPRGRTCEAHVVRPGESLWSITHDHLAAPTSRTVDRGWRDLYAANRRVVGADPDLIRPGTRLDISTVASDCD